MTNLFLNNKTIALAAFALIGGLSFASLQAQASTTSQLLQCNAKVKDRVVRCCETVLRNKEKPIWFLESGSSCSSIVVCTKKQAPIRATYVAAPIKCYIQLPTNNGQGSSNPQKRPQQNFTFN